MARRTRTPAKAGKKNNEETGIEEFGMDEVDAFADARDKSLIERAGLNDPTNDIDDSDDEEAVEGVMDVDSDAEVEKYKKKFQGPIDESDEEFFRGEDQSGDEDGEDGDGRERWGGDYYGADEAEDEEDENLLEEEALRLQKKHMEELNMDDFMVDEVEDWQSEKEKKRKQAKEEDSDADEVLSEGNDDKFEEMLKKGTKESRTEMINKKYPEYLPLIMELKELQKVHENMKASSATGVLTEVQSKALSLYVGSIVSYLALFATRLHGNERFDMKDEDVMVSILSNRELWRQAKSLKEPQNVKSEEEEEEEEVEEVESEDDLPEDKKSDDESSEESDAVSENEKETSSSDGRTPDFTKLRTIKKAVPKKLEDMDDLDAEDKKGRRKTLGFYTSKIDKRDLGKTVVDGDVDAAYEEDHSKKNYSQKRRFQPSQRGRRRRP